MSHQNQDQADICPSQNQDQTVLYVRVIGAAAGGYDGRTGPVVL